ncbi:hypothetical protein [Mycobacterium nebraskense]|uniref:hypothetical protein n=1 Tax=Mycobacterium nebraskense TaxID=244292 RepID=UPI001E3D9B41|nr:hypothetical protein [Mycobacterium nebraskense]
MAPYRVVQWSTGNIGKRALGVLLDRDDFDVVGVHAFGSDKVGRDAGELADQAPVGVAATGDADALLELRPDCVCVTCPASSTTTWCSGCCAPASTSSPRATS